jgi:hypothetical protein
MRQRIAHGAELDIATPAEIAAIFANQKRDDDIEYYTRFRSTFLNGSGTTTDSVKVPSQYDWLLERISVAGPGAVNALVGVYENEVVNSTLLEIIQLGSAGFYTDSFSNNLYVPANSQIVFAVVTGVAGQQISYNYQIKMIKHQAKR